MELIQYSDYMDDYLGATDIIDYNNDSIRALSDKLMLSCNDTMDYLKAAYEYVRDVIPHSADARRQHVTCNASEVLAVGHGICFAKSHLLAALLRCQSIPTGLCYQKLILDVNTAPTLVLHGLNGVYIEEESRWIRLDARGNTNGVHAQFSLIEEQLAYPVRPELGEKDILVVYPNPDQHVIDIMTRCKTREELRSDLPRELDYIV